MLYVCMCNSPPFEKGLATSSVSMCMCSSSICWSLHCLLTLPFCSCYSLIMREIISRVCESCPLPSNPGTLSLPLLPHHTSHTHCMHYICTNMSHRRCIRCMIHRYISKMCVDLTSMVFLVLLLTAFLTVKLHSH